MGTSCSACSFCQKNGENQLEIQIEVSFAFKCLELLKSRMDFNQGSCENPLLKLKKY